MVGCGLACPGGGGRGGGWDRRCQDPGARGLGPGGGGGVATRNTGPYIGIFCSHA